MKVFYQKIVFVEFWVENFYLGCPNSILRIRMDIFSQKDSNENYAVCSQNSQFTGEKCLLTEYWGNNFPFEI